MDGGVRKKAEEKKNISTSEKGRITRFTDFNLHFVHNSIERFSSLLSFYFFQRRHSSSILMFDLKKAEKKYIGDEKVIFFRSQHPIHFHFFTHSENVKYHFPIFFSPAIFFSLFFSDGLFSAKLFFGSCWWILPHSRGVRFTGRQFSLNWYRLVTLRLRYLLFRSSESPCTLYPISFNPIWLSL